MSPRTQMLDAAAGVIDTPADMPTVEHGLYWPDGRVTPLPAANLATWADNPDVIHVTRKVGAWTNADLNPLKRAS